MVESRAIVPEEDLHSGKGVHRRFDRHELAIACILVAFARRGIRIGELVKLGDAFRGPLGEQLRWHTEPSFGLPTVLIVTWKGDAVQRVAFATGDRHLSKEAPALFAAVQESDTFAAVVSVTTALAGLPP